MSQRSLYVGSANILAWNRARLVCAVLILGVYILELFVSFPVIQFVLHGEGAALEWPALDWEILGNWGCGA